MAGTCSAATLAGASARARASGPDRPARAVLPSPRKLDARVAIPVPMRGAPAESIRGASRDVRVWHVPAGDVGAGNDGADSRGGHGDGRHFQRVCACKDGVRSRGSDPLHPLPIKVAATRTRLHRFRPARHFDSIVIGFSPSGVRTVFSADKFLFQERFFFARARATGDSKQKSATALKRETSTPAHPLAALTLSLRFTPHGPPRACRVSPARRGGRRGRRHARGRMTQRERGAILPRLAGATTTPAGVRSAGYRVPVTASAMSSTPRRLPPRRTLPEPPHDGAADHAVRRQRAAAPSNARLASDGRRTPDNTCGSCSCVFRVVLRSAVSGTEGRFRTGRAASAAPEKRMARPRKPRSTEARAEGSSRGVRGRTA